MRQRQQQQEEQEERPQQNQQRTSIVSAPVSREGSNTNGTRSTPSQIRLTTAQRDAAKSAGVTEKVYAEQLQKLNEMKANGSYTGGN